MHTLLARGVPRGFQLRRALLVHSVVALTALTAPHALAQPQDDEAAAGETGTPSAEVTTTAAPSDEAATAESPTADPSAEGSTRELPVSPTPAAALRETECSDGRDDDGDGLIDCADADCYDAPICRAGGNEERNDARCSDWIDNDGDGAVDCDDQDCQGPGITVCGGSWQGSPSEAITPEHDRIPELTGDMSVEDLIGRGGDIDGERNDAVCSDGFDNDGDGRIDCADFGCRFDPSVTVCNNTPSLRFSVVAGVGGSLLIDEIPDIDGDGFTNYTDPTGDIRFTRLQLRALGQIPFIENSFFLINIRAERTLRLTFATFNIPLGNQGHYLSINSGSGGLSPGLIISTSKHPLLDPAYYLFDRFERGSGAAIEVGGPITEDNVLRFRLFAAGGSGEFSGNVGGRFFRSEDRNFSYAGGAQLQVNIVGHYDRLDTPLLYSEVPLTVAALAGARWDQRAVERYAAWNAFAVTRFWRFNVQAETYGRYVLDYDGIEMAWNVTAGFLIVPRTLYFAADVGGFFVPRSFDPDVVNDGGGFSAQFREQREQFQVRSALHWYYFRHIGRLSLLYAMRMDCERVFSSDGVCKPPSTQPEAALTSHEVRLEAQFRF